MFYVAEALLNERGLQFSKHTAVHSAFGRDLAKTGELDPKYHRWLLDSFDERIIGDYGMDDEPSPEQVAKRIAQAREFLGEASRYLAAHS